MMLFRSVPPRHVWSVIIVAVLLRAMYLGVVGGIDTDNWVAMDSGLYDGIAQGMLASGEYNRMDISTGTLYVETERVPGYGIYLAMFYGALGFEHLWPLLGQVLLAALTAAVIGALGEEFHRGLFLWAGMAAALNLNTITHTALILSDTVFLTFFTLHLLFTVRLLRDFDWREAALSGLFLGFALMTRSILMFWVWALPILLLGIAVWRGRYRAGLTTAVVVWLLALSLTLPLLIRNHQQFGHFALQAQSGTNALNWYVPLTREFSRGEPWAVGVKRMAAIMERYIEENRASDQLRNPFESSDLHMAVAKQEMLRLDVDEIAYAWLSGAVINVFTPSVSSISLLDKLDRPRFYYVQGANFIDKAVRFLLHPDNRLYLSVVLPGILVTLLLRVAMVYGFVHILRDREVWPALFLMLMAALYILAVTGPLVSAARYRLPIEPIMTVFAAMGIKVLYERYVARRDLRATAPERG